MKLLQICSKSPWPPSEGGPIAVNNITQGLLQSGHSVQIFTLSTHKYPVHLYEIPEDYRKQTCFKYADIDTRINVPDAFLNLFTAKSYNIQRFISKKAEKKITEILSENKFDIIQLEGLYVAPYIKAIRSCSDAKIVLRAHNVEHLIWKRLASGCNNFLKKMYLKLLAARLKRFELKTMKMVDGIAAITPVDMQTFIDLGCSCPVISIPVGIDTSGIITEISRRAYPGFFHLGSMDWMPNQEGIRWFIEKAWNEFHKNNPQYIFTLAGRNMPGWLDEKRYPGVHVIGEVEDAYHFMQSNSVMIVPLLSGSGIRVKILEGMACGNTVITSSVGAEGISCTHGKDIYIANTVDEWIHCLTKCIISPEISALIGYSAYELIKSDYDIKKITAHLVQFYRKISGA